MDHFQFSTALEDIWTLIRRCNKYVDETTPWILAKEGRMEELGTVLYHLAEALRIVSILIYPTMEHTALEIREQLGIQGEIKLEDAKVWGLTPTGVPIQKGKIIFPRLDVEEEMQALSKAHEDLIAKRKSAHGQAPSQEAEKPGKGEISLEDFEKLEIKLAKVVSVEDHPNADRLYLLHLQLGEEERTIVTNVKDRYKPQDLEGKKILVLTNLKPHKFRGIESQGMLLAAEDQDGNLSIATTLEDIKDGAVIS